MLAALQVTHAIADRLRDHSALGVAECAWKRDSVHTSRAWPLTEDGLPAWRVYPDDESIESDDLHAPALQDHRLQLVLEGVVRHVNELDEWLGLLASQALSAVFGDPLVDGDALDQLGARLQLSLTGINRQPSTDGEAATGRVLVVLTAAFQTRVNDPDTIV